MINCNPIGYYHSIHHNFSKDTLPRQPQGSHIGYILLTAHKNYDVAIIDLQGFSHIWLIFWFHKTATWKPKVLPPKSAIKRGVFATRSPHRPNPIGLSCVRLLEQTRQKIIIEGADLLDETPILDIKPYIKYSDSHPDSIDGWVDQARSLQKTNMEVFWDAMAHRQCQWLEERGIGIRQSIERSFHSTGYFPSSSNRIYKDTSCHYKADEIIYIKAWKTWRVRFFFTQMENDIVATIHIQGITSGYVAEDMTPDVLGIDIWNDKKIHLEFKKVFL